MNLYIAVIAWLYRCVDQATYPAWPALQTLISTKWGLTA